MHEGTLKGIGFFGSEILHLISSGQKESLSTVVQHFEENDIIEYIFKKYQNKFFHSFDNNMYDNKSLNEYFHKYSASIQGNESRKYGIQNDDDGLLLIMALIMVKVEDHSINYTV